MPPQLIQLLALIENGGDDTEMAEAWEALMSSLPEGRQQEMMKILKQMGF